MMFGINKVNVNIKYMEICHIFLEACSFKHQTATVQFNNPQTQPACIIINSSVNSITELAYNSQDYQLFTFEINCFGEIKIDDKIVQN